MRTVWRAAVGAVALIAALIDGSTPAGAAQGYENGSVLAGTVVLPTFPCPPPDEGEPACVGNFAVSTFGNLEGIDGSSPWHVSMNAVTVGEFTYIDETVPVPCSEGFATGSASLDTRSDGQVFGSYVTWPVVRPIRHIVVTYSFSWRRLGTVAVLTITDATIDVEVDVLGWRTVMTGGDASGVVAFVPTPDSGVPSGCAGGVPTEIRGSILGNVSGITVRP